MGVTAHTAERRKNGRKRASWPVVVLDGNKRIPCGIVDISRAGARLMCSDKLPTQPTLLIVGDNFGPVECRVIWCRGSLAGIKFAESDAVKWAVSALAPRTATFGRRR